MVDSNDVGGNFSAIPLDQWTRLRFVFDSPLQGPLHLFERYNSQEFLSARIAQLEVRVEARLHEFLFSKHQPLAGSNKVAESVPSSDSLAAIVEAHGCNRDSCFDFESGE